MIPLEDAPALILFARVVQLRSFSAAARDARLGRSAVSKRIAQLEERLGARLLQRSTRSLSLTDEGMRVYGHCVAMLEAAGAARSALEGRQAAPRGTLRVNAPVTFAQMQLTPAVAAFLQAHPGIEVELTLDDHLVDVVDGGFDLAIRITRLKESSLHARRLARDRLVVCASPGYLARRGVPRAPAELIHHNCLHYANVPVEGEWRFRGPGGPDSIPVHGTLTTNDGAALRSAALAGLGLVVLPSFMVAREVRQGRLVLVLEGARRAEIGIYAVFAHRAQMPARTRLFLDFLVRRFAKLRWDEDPLEA
jgi:DNA-binding transcriptional LysR family regulator